MEPIRYYLHGDQQENHKKKYYCLKCDSFEFKDHFKQPSHVDSNIERFQNSLEKYKCANRNFLSSNYRPQTAINLFSKSLPLKVSRFYSWLNKQIKRNDPIGDLALDASSDSSFPKTSNSYKIIRKYLITKSACDEALQALYEAFNEFYKKTNLRSGITLKLRFKIFKRDKYRCQICGARANDKGIKLEIDHKIPLSKGGTNHSTNLWTLCFKCNRGKGNLSL